MSTKPAKTSKNKKRRSKPTRRKTRPSVDAPSVHPWRVCPYGEHWVKTHPMHVPPSKTHPEGTVTTRHEHCADNPSGKDQLYTDEIQEISSRHFSNLKNKPCPLSLKFENGNMYDDLIAGWVQYWNEVIKPSEALDPNLIKALVASESGFDPEILANKENQNSARGLTQVTNATRRILGDDKGELKDHYVNVTREDLNIPSVNICAGIRWLFQKRILSSARLERQATWLETVYDYKAASKGTKSEAQKIMRIFLEKYEDLQKCGS